MDHELGRATGWLPGQLSGQGRAQAQQLGRRRLDGWITAMFSSDLARAAQTASAAFGTSAIPVLYDWRLRECDTGSATGCPWPSCTLAVANTWTTLPGGENWRQAVERAGRFLTDLLLRWNGQRILVIGHIATRWALGHFISGVPLEDLAEQDFARQEGWEYPIS